MERNSEMEATRAACERYLAGCGAPEALGRERCFEWLARFDRDDGARSTVAQFAGHERAILCHAALAALTKLPGFPVSEAVRHLFLDEFRFCADTPPKWQDKLAHDGTRFKELARLVTLRRFPGGQFHWEQSGVPRSTLWRAPRKEVFRLAAFLAAHGGFRPYWEIHLNARRRITIAILETESDNSYRLLAGCLARNPGILGMMAASWLFDPALGEVSPRLGWIHRTLAGRGARFFDLGDAPKVSGFLTGSAERAKAYDEGRYKPRTTLILWPREELSRWAQNSRTEPRAQDPA